MKAWMAALIGGTPEIETLTFTSNATWTATGVSQLLSIEGKGGAGEPGYTDYYYDIEIVETRNYSNGSPQKVINSNDVASGEAPADYCQNINGRDSTGTYTGTRCYTHTQHEDVYPPTTGASATAFGYTFPGGVGGPASTLTYGNVSVTLGNSYSIVVPAGGQVKITYYK